MLRNPDTDTDLGIIPVRDSSDGKVLVPMNFLGKFKNHFISSKDKIYKYMLFGNDTLGYTDIELKNDEK